MSSVHVSQQATFDQASSVPPCSISQVRREPLPSSQYYQQQLFSCSRSSLQRQDGKTHHLVWCLLNQGCRSTDLTRTLGPPTLPFIGNLHQIPKRDLHLQYQKWGRECTYFLDPCRQLGLTGLIRWTNLLNQAGCSECCCTNQW